MKKVFFVFLLIVIPVIVGLAVAEGVLRLISSTPPSHFKTPDRLAHHKLIPNSSGREANVEYSVVYRANSEGFRGVDHAVEKPEGVYRVVVLGDSYTLGYGVTEEKIFTTRLQEVLNEKYSEGTISFEVINLGMISYSPIVEYAVLKNYGLKYSPDLVVMCLDWSDLMNDFWYEQQTVFDEKKRPVEFNVSRPEKKPLESLAERSYLYHLVKHRLNPPPKAPDIEPGNPFKDTFFFMRDNNQDKYANLYVRTQKYIRQTKELAVENSSDFLLVTYPNGAQVSEKEWNIGRQLFGLRQGEVYSTAPFEVIETFAAANGIDYLSMLASFRESEEFPLYFETDGHFNETGHNLFAGLLADRINKYLNK